MKLPPLHIAAIDDDDDDLELLRLRLHDVLGANLTYAPFQDVQRGTRYVLRQRPDVLMLDFRLGAVSGLDVLRSVRDAGFTGAVLILTGARRTDVAVEMMKHGATDYLGKDELNDDVLLHTLRYCVQKAASDHALERSQTALRDSEALARAVVETASEGILTADLDGTLRTVNSAASRMFGRSDADLRGAHLSVLLPWARDGLPGSDDVRRCALPPQGRREVLGVRRDGAAFPLALSAAAVGLGDREIRTLVVRDISDERANQERLADAIAQLEKTRDDLQAILNHLRLGAALLDPSGQVRFLNDQARALFQRGDADHSGFHWRELMPLSRGASQALEAAIDAPADMRRKVVVRVPRSEGTALALEVDVHDDPERPEQRVLFFYDVSDVEDLRRQLDDRAGFADLVGRSGAMQQVYQLIRDIAPVDVTVLVEGETGTGKELVARAIHRASPRASKPFVAVNCAGLSDSLLTSQLFGHARGAFTGAISAHLGVFESAHGGTIFLDEIGDVPPKVQTSLLRVLQEREVTRLGESAPRPIDVRVIAATHRDLSAEVEAGRFRLDLLYRLRVARLQLPPLRARTGDVPVLARWFLRRVCGETGLVVDGITDDAMRALATHPWPGNVRELRSAIEFAVVRAKQGRLQRADLPAEVLSGTDHTLNERDRILDALERAAFNRTRAARLLGMSRATFYRRLTELQIDVRRRADS